MTQIIHITPAFRTQAIELVNQFFHQVNSMHLDGIFKIKTRAATKMVDIYQKLSGTEKVLFIGLLSESELVSVLIAKVEERPYLEEEKILFIDLAVTKNGKMKKGYMKQLLQYTEVWAKKKNIKILELRAIKENKNAVKYWMHSGYDDFYIRFRKII